MPSAPPSIAGKGRDSLSMDSIDLSPYMQETRDRVNDQGISFPDEAHEDSDEVDLLQEALQGMVDQCRGLQNGWNAFHVIPEDTPVLQRVRMKKENTKLVASVIRDGSGLLQSIKFLQLVLTDEKVPLMAQRKSEAEKSQTILQIDRAVEAINQALTFPPEKQDLIKAFLEDNKRYIELKSALQQFQQQLKSWRQHFEAS